MQYLQLRILCEMAAYEKNKGEVFMKNYSTSMFNMDTYKEDLISITKKGMNGQQEIAQMMEDFRNNPPKVLAGSKVVELLDYQKQVKTNLQTGNTETISLPKSNVLQFITEDGSKISARPSGPNPRSNSILV